MEPGVEVTLAAFSLLIPQNTHLLIEINASIGRRYVYRLVYTSPNSGRTMCMVAKSDHLPIEDTEDLRFILRQLYLTPKEASLEFARLYWHERNARQSAFLSAGKLENIRVSDKRAHLDRPEGWGEITGI